MCDCDSVLLCSRSRPRCAGEQTTYPPTSNNPLVLSESSGDDAASKPFTGNTTFSAAAPAFKPMKFNVEAPAFVPRSRSASQSGVLSANQSPQPSALEALPTAAAAAAQRPSWAAIASKLPAEGTNGGSAGSAGGMCSSSSLHVLVVHLLLVCVTFISIRSLLASLPWSRVHGKLLQCSSASMKWCVLGALFASLACVCRRGSVVGRG